jgi:hypothetical protein
MSDTLIGAIISLVSAVIGGLIVAIPQYSHNKRQNDQWYAEFTIPLYLTKLGDLYSAIIDYNKTITHNAILLEEKYVQELLNRALTTNDTRIRESLQMRNQELRATRDRFEHSYAHALPYLQDTPAALKVELLRAAYFLVASVLEDNTGPVTPILTWTAQNATTKAP